MERCAQWKLKLKPVASYRPPSSRRYSDYKYDLTSEVIGRSDIWLFHEEHLPDEYGHRLDQRIVEYPGFFLNSRRMIKSFLTPGPF